MLSRKLELRSYDDRDVTVEVNRVVMRRRERCREALLVVEEGHIPAWSVNPGEARTRGGHWRRTSLRLSIDVESPSWWSLRIAFVRGVCTVRLRDARGVMLFHGDGYVVELPRSAANHWHLVVMEET